MARAWLIDGRSIARKVSRSSAYQIKDCGANRECPKCHCHIDNSDVTQEWPGLPIGVKFDPSDAQLLEHLEAKCAVGNSKPHMFIDEFIPTLDGDKGICYAHPAKLPGAKKDGNSVHFFHRTNNAYATGQRKRRKIHCEVGSNEEGVRWHKTGKTKPVMDNGVQKGCKKIMVLYKSSKKGSKPDKSKWVMHQYHLGTDEDEKEGEYLVSKIFYQQKQTEKNDDNLLIEDNDILSHQTSPRTPNSNPPNPPRPAKSVMYDDIANDNITQLAVQNNEIKEEAPDVPAHVFQLEGDVEFPEWFAGESQAVENSDFTALDDSLLCNEIFVSAPRVPNNSGVNRVSYTGMAHNTNELNGNNNEPCGIAELENLELDTPPDFQLADLQFGSQESILGWLDRL
ncbi:hypothetical protein H0E87_000880 [Populus deltoides]|uniref:NAC domain-containing protein n=2 Tax=Populus deltoides TaxID=3696 RepID=A0A8T2ZPE5_POPDE|nr:hypothetical protein H0E87_000880 [Populus deltoides]